MTIPKVFEKVFQMVSRYGNDGNVFKSKVLRDQRTIVQKLLLKKLTKTTNQI